ncbi:hypothetical protein O181_122827 [Austropuccinia psidii MF-1]|uniref:Uncharacterized protein n=1 Tax=Austropuccinia psidii MF-1 TaxID=1389203 RepID=A0A9Q3KNW7_9BASI|nr:hypothetical protein [Austropuccinia psidii MF-1]
MSKEDQINLVPYANLFTCLKVFSRFITSGIPMPNPSQQPQQAFTLSWCSGAHHSRFGGTVTSTQNDPPQLVLRQSQPENKLGPIGHTISFMDN